MLIFNQMTDYAMVIVHFMAKNGGSNLDASSVAERTGIPQPSVAQLLKKLVQAGICGALRGAKGGYHLALPAEDISVWDVIVAIQGEIVLARCMSHTPDCAKIGACSLQPQWVYLNQLLQNFLGAIHFDHLQAPLAQHPLLQSLQRLIDQHQGVTDGNS